MRAGQDAMGITRQTGATVATTRQFKQERLDCLQDEVERLPC